jgi:hypothetical protein
MKFLYELVVTCKEMNREIRSYFRFFLNNKIKFLREYIMVNETCYCQYIFYRNLRARGHFRKRPGLEYRKKKYGYSFIYIYIYIYQVLRSRGGVQGKLLITKMQCKISSLDMQEIGVWYDLRK